eukprot:GEMP01114409.1.p1 GENE.GEMP01114409.1~~GEMP01114409.1.p1  ORF type:complete len:114 (+),score=15.25 GEMP01114409.1:148-489(+)
MHYPVKSDPKAFFSIERTFIHWVQFSIILVALGTLVMKSREGAITRIIGDIYYVVALLFLVLPYLGYRERISGLERGAVKTSEVYISRKVPIILTILLASAMTAGICLVVAPT